MTINVYEQYFGADLAASGVQRRGALVMLIADSEAGRIRYEAAVTFFPHRDEEDFAVSYDAYFSSVLFDARADILVYGMGERATLEAPERLRDGRPLEGIRGTCTAAKGAPEGALAIPGFEEITGIEFAERLVDQALAQGAEMEAAEVTGIRANEDGTFTAITEEGEIDGRAVILATGARHRLLGLPDEEAFVGQGLSFCAVCDGAYYRDRDVAVIGGGNSAMQEALLLADLCHKVTVVQNLAFLTGEEKLAAQLRSRPNVEILYSTLAAKYLGSPADGITGLVVRSESGEERTIPADGVFVAVGLEPQNTPFADWIALDARGYADSDEGCTTVTPGIFVAGDCRSKRIRQVTTAAADGAVAALAACDWIDTNKK